MSLSHAVPVCPVMALKCPKWHSKLVGEKDRKIGKIVGFSRWLDLKSGFGSGWMVELNFPYFTFFTGFSFFYIISLSHVNFFICPFFVDVVVVLLHKWQCCGWDSTNQPPKKHSHQMISSTRNHVVFHGCSIPFSKKLPIRSIPNFSIFKLTILSSCQLDSWLGCLVFFPLCPRDYRQFSWASTMAPRCKKSLFLSLSLLSHISIDNQLTFGGFITFRTWSSTMDVLIPESAE